MHGALTRGQAAVLAAVGRMVVDSAPHALLLVGPSSVGKTTLALDLAAGLLCGASDPADRPCRQCRGCRLVASGNHPDIHRLAPEGPGGQIRIGVQAHPEPGTVRWLVSELALLPMEGGARVAIIEAAQRLNEDAQNALLKTLEEPPAGVTIVLCADDEDRLLPTIRSRCVRLRLGPVGGREIERLLEERGLAEPPLAGRLARLAGGRPGLAIAYARAPEAAAARGEAARMLLDLLAERRARRLVAIRELLTLAATAAGALAATAAEGGTAPPAGSGRGRAGRRSPSASSAAAPPATSDVDPVDEDGEGEPDDAGSRKPAPAAVRRRAAAWLLDVWRDSTRDLIAVALGRPAGVHDPWLLEDLAVATGRVPVAAAVAFLERLALAAVHLEANVSPELELDALVLAWPRAAAAA